MTLRSIRDISPPQRLHFFDMSIPSLPNQSLFYPFCISVEAFGILVVLGGCSSKKKRPTKTSDVIPAKLENGSLRVDRIYLFTAGTDSHFARVPLFVFHAITGDPVGKTEEALCVKVHVVLRFPNDGFKSFAHADFYGEAVFCLRKGRRPSHAISSFPLAYSTHFVSFSFSLFSE
jgi:hypothetical protein